MATAAFRFSRVLFFLLALPLALHAQADSLGPDQFHEDSLRIMRPRPVRFQFKFDTRTSFVLDRSMTMNGYDAGILVNGKLRLTLGYYHLDHTWSVAADEGEIRQKLVMHMGTLNTEMLYVQRRFLSLGFPLEPGLGYYRLSTELQADGRSMDHLEGIVAFSNFGLAATFTPIRWFGLKGMIGYRKAILSSEKRFDFNGVFSSIALNIDMQEAFRDIRMYRLLKKYHPHHFRGLQTFTNLLVD
jgi:hypothetical protein